MDGLGATLLLLALAQGAASTAGQRRAGRQRRVLEPFVLPLSLHLLSFRSVSCSEM